MAVSLFVYGRIAVALDSGIEAFVYAAAGDVQ
jgi:hypothetical protein